MDGPRVMDCLVCDEPNVDCSSCCPTCNFQFDPNLVREYDDAARFLEAERLGKPVALPILLGGLVWYWRRRLCPFAPECNGWVVATVRRGYNHVYLCCSNNDPAGLHGRDQQCRWSFNKVKELDPLFAAAVLERELARAEARRFK